MSAPLYLVESERAVTTVLRRLARAGWHTREGFALPESEWDVTPGQLALYGRVADPDTAALAVLAAARGAAIVAVARPDSEIGQALLADLGRLGPVGRDPDAEPSGAPDDALPLNDAQRALLHRLAEGETIAAAAEAEFLSLRTANRRIAEARAALGVHSTREAVLAYLRAQRGTA